MKHSCKRLTVLALALFTVTALSLPVSASVFKDETIQSPTVSTFSKNTTVPDPISFSGSDFRVVGGSDIMLDSVMISSLPDPNIGTLTIGTQPLAKGDMISLNALNGMCFYPKNNSTTTAASTSFSFEPVFSSGESGEAVEVNLYLLTSENNPPVAENMEFVTYKNIAYTGYLSAVDPEGDLITFQLVDKPARGAITFSEDGSSEFVYTPYENKTGKDSFTFVAIDSLGNTSEEATVKVKIEKPSTKVTYADLNGHPAHNAAIKLAENGIYIGAQLDNSYHFQPELPVTRSEFLALAMSTVGLEALNGISTTGFFDDDSIETWAKPYVSSALKSGVIQGSVTNAGQVVFRGENMITHAEAAVLLNRLLSVTDIPSGSWDGSATSVPTWASQAVMNLETVGILQNVDNSLANSLTRADAAQMLAASLDVIAARKDSSSWFD